MTVAIAEEFGRIPMSPFLKATLARAADYAAAQMHREVTLEHLLLALAEDPEASIVLKSSTIDIQRLMSDVSGYLGRIDDRVEGTVPPAASISGDLRRILEASAAAASQGRRREINGAIVLAAIVGDGKSPAAHMLRSQGLTFEQAIRALQQAASAPQPATAGRPPSTNQASGTAPRATTADDIMASARERVMTRTAPPDQTPGRMPPPAPPVEAAPPPPAPVLQIPVDRPALAPSPSATPLAPEWTSDSAHGPASSPSLPPAEPAAGRMAQSPSPRIDTAGGPAVASQAPIPVPYPQAAHPARTQTAGPQLAGPIAPAPAASQGAPAPGPQQPMPAPGQGWAPTPGPAPQRQNPFPPMNGMRPPTGGPAPLPPFPPAHHGAPLGPPPPGQGLPGGALPQPMARPQGPPQSAPWAEQGGQPGQRGQHYDEAMARLDARRPQQPQQNIGGLPPPQQQRRPAASVVVQAGQLVENIPRRMRIAIAVIVEARVARADVKAIADGLQGDGAVYRHEVTVTKAMSVRLRAPDGGFTIETASPETQWIENVLGLMSNDYASWRWSVTPQLRGKRKLQLIISARTVGTDGLTAETALPDQVIDVAVGINVARTLAKWGTWIAAAVGGGLLSHFGKTIFEFGKALLGSGA